MGLWMPVPTPACSKSAPCGVCLQPSPYTPLSFLLSFPLSRWRSEQQSLEALVYSGCISALTEPAVQLHGHPCLPLCIDVGSDLRDCPDHWVE